MRFIFVVLVFICSPFALCNAQTQDESAVVDLGSILVEGVRPGPKLWRVKKGEHTLWVLGELSPLPKRMKWHSQRVTEVIQQSQAYLAPSSFTAEVGFFQGLSLATSAIGIKKNPDKKKLSDIIPADIYQQWLVLKKKYLGRNKRVEKLRPLFAADKLYTKAISKVGLTEKTKVYKKVRKLAKKNKLEFVYPTIKIELNKPKAGLKKFKKTQISDLQCFRQTLDRLEVDLDAMRQRANAWSEGNLSILKDLKFTNQNKSCTSAILENSVIQDMGLADIRSRMRAIWLEKAKESLEKYPSTFAILPIYHLLGENSYVDILAQEGYTVIAPH